MLYHLVEILQPAVCLQAELALYHAGLLSPRSFLLVSAHDWTRKSQEAQEGAEGQHPGHHQACYLPTEATRRRQGVSWAVLQEEQGSAEGAPGDAGTYTERMTVMPETSDAMIETIAAQNGCGGELVLEDDMTTATPCWCSRGPWT